MNQNVFEKVIAAATKLKVRSALNPALWYAAIMCVICYAVAIYFARVGHMQLALILIYISLIPIGLVPVGFIYFMIFSPDSLRSEEFELKKISMISGKHTTTKFPSSDVPLVAAQTAPLLGGGQ